MFGLMDEFLNNDSFCLQKDIVDHVEYTVARSRFSFDDFEAYQVFEKSLQCTFSSYDEVMDKSWMNKRNRNGHVYRNGVDEFLNFAYRQKDNDSKIPCPCKLCNNFRDQPREIVRGHLIKTGIRVSYVKWTYHGEAFDNDLDEFHDVVDNNDVESDDNDMNNMLNDFGTANLGADWNDTEYANNLDPSQEEIEIDAFLNLLNDAKQDLYPGCKNYSKLSFIITLLHLKTMNGWTAKSFDMLLGVLRNALPVSDSIPKSFYEAKKIIRDLGFRSEKIHACVNDCVLFRKQYASLSTCPNNLCKEPRYKSLDSKVPRKVMRYFPLKPRLQRLYVNKEIACDMRWLKEKRVDDANIMRHPADSESWKHFDKTYADFAHDPRNIRLGLATDGFNPFGNMSNAYSIWPVFVVPYNLPPWRCMKDPFVIMSMLIPGPNSPGNDIDVYMQPLVDELMELWHGIETYDAYAHEKFVLRAALLWTINDFPAYASLSGWSNKGYDACPICMSETNCFYLHHSKKMCYRGHRRFLPTNHRWRKEKKTFDGNVEFRDPIIPLSGHEIMKQLEIFEGEQFFFGKAASSIKQRKRKHDKNPLNWKKKSLFFQLPYWTELKLRHNLDIMHVVKNVCESVFSTIMDIGGKTKDTWKARKDLMELGFRKELHLIPQDNSFVKPMACYNLTKVEKQKVCNFLASIKYPDNFASNISRCVKNGEFQISGMKSHDFHILMQRILPLAIRGCLNKEVRQVLFELSDFFKKLCSKILLNDVLDVMETNISVILCKLERLMPPAFFDIMVHLMVHLPNEAKLAGPAQYRWMYPFERKMGTLKGYVHNKARPEGCIAERYIDTECLTFCSMYLNDISTIFNKGERNNENEGDFESISVFSCKSRPLGGSKQESLDSQELEKIHICVLNNCSEIEEYVNEHKQKLEAESCDNIDQRHDREFASWFKKRVMCGSERFSEEIRALSFGLDDRIRRYSGCMVNGYRFHTQEREYHRKTQNSGVVVQGDHGNNAIDFYGVVQDIIEVEYFLGKKRVVLFKCDWWRVGDSSGLRVDKSWGITSVNISRKWYEDQPYVLAYQVEQVFYVEDMKLGKNWYVVQRFSPRGTYNVPGQLDKSVDNQEVHQEEEPDEVITIDESDEVASLLREGLVSLHVDFSTFQNEVFRDTTDFGDNDFINDEENIDKYHTNTENEDEELWTDNDNDSI